MGNGIKIKERKREVRFFDKGVAASRRLKTAVAHTKEKAEHSYCAEKNSPDEYATDKVYSNADRLVRETVPRIGRRGKKAAKAAKGGFQRLWARAHERNDGYSYSQSVGRDSAGNLNRKNKEMPDTMKNGMEPSYVRQVNGQNAGTVNSVPSPPRKQEQRVIKTLERHKKTVKQAPKSIKAAVRTPIKMADRTVGTTKRTVKTVQANFRASRKAAQGARVAAEKAAAATKAAVKASVSAIKGIIASGKAFITALIAGGWFSVAIILVVILFGGAMALFSGGSSNTATPISDEVTAYEPLIKQYAIKHGIPDYVELIKAVMMQESGGRGLDPMQSAEGSFNTLYPNKPNGITNPEYSIACGIQELKDCLTKAKVENPVDMNRIKLALQGYNFGNGYITWAVNKDGGYTSANAVDFSIMMAAEMGWAGYGDTAYVPHVLRYYPFGRQSVSTGNQAIVDVALSQVGNVGGELYWSWYGYDTWVNWCACFVSWCANECGYIDSGVIPKFSGCTSGGMAWFKEHGQWQERDYIPNPGDIIFFDWANCPTPGDADHVGIVERVEDGRVFSIEGNTGDGGNVCLQKSYPIGYSEIRGYGVPQY